jgi:hypothetical protein
MTESASTDPGQQDTPAPQPEATPDPQPEAPQPDVAPDQVAPDQKVGVGDQPTQWHE